MENMERVQTMTAPEIMLPRSQDPETKKLLNIVTEQAAIMGRGECQCQLENVDFRRNEMSFFADQHAVSM